MSLAQDRVAHDRADAGRPAGTRGSPLRQFDHARVPEDRPAEAGPIRSHPARRQPAGDADLGYGAGKRRTLSPPAGPRRTEPNGPGPSGNFGAAPATTLT